jgi:DNA-binding MarR family transcriptional regulator
MIVRGPRPQHSFTVISNAVIEDRRLSYKARGLLIYILSKPDHWRTNMKHLAAQSSDGYYSVQSGMAELEQAGYIKRIRLQDTHGHWSTNTVVHDHPVDNPVDK